MDRLPSVVPTRVKGLPSIPHQMNMLFDCMELQGMSQTQRARAITHLAKMLINAYSVGTVKEHDDDDD